MVAVLDGRVGLLRPGGVTREQIEVVVGPLSDSEDGHRSPGRLARHYAPSAPMRLDVTHPASGHAYIAFGPGAPSGELVWNLSAAGDLAEAAANLFAHLRAADRAAPSGIDVAPIPAHALGEAINDRLKRAAGMVG